MGATSATGVGYGSVEGMDMGRKEYTIGANRLIGPRVVACDNGTLSGGAATIILPLLHGAVTDYAVLVSDSSGTAAAISATLTFDVEDTKITVAGTTTHTFNWAIIKQGLMP